jgi:hypothetical protein
MRITLESDARNYLSRKHHDVITVNADQECFGAQCSEFIYPVIRYTKPDAKSTERYDRFDLDGITVWFDKQLETVPEVTLKLEHHMLRDRILVDGLPVHPEVTHIKL